MKRKVMFLIVMSALCSMPALAAQNSSPKPTAPVEQQNGPTTVLGQPPAAVTPSAPLVVASPAGVAGDTPSAQAQQAKPPTAQALFEESLQQMMPLDKGQIQEFREWSDGRDRALLPVSPSLSSRTVRVSLEPGRAPVKVNTTANVATSLVFHDSTGQAWPVTSVTNGGPTFFQVLRPDLQEGNLLNVMPLQPHGSSTIVVTLAKRDVPLIIRLEADSVRSPERKADALVLFQLAHHGPNAQVSITQGVKDTASSAMLSFLDQVPPAGAVRIKTDPQDENIKIWKLNEILYVRTTHTMVWPAWVSVVNGAGDVKCYESQLTPRIIMSQGGVIKSLKVKE